VTLRQQVTQENGIKCGSFKKKVIVVESGETVKLSQRWGKEGSEALEVFRHGGGGNERRTITWNGGEQGEKKLGESPQGVFFGKKPKAGGDQISCAPGNPGGTREDKIVKKKKKGKREKKTKALGKEHGLPDILRQTLFRK